MWKRIFGTVAVVLAVGLAGVALAAEKGKKQRRFPKEPPKPPLGLPEIPWPKDNPYSAAKAELGWLLYFDTRLSSDDTISCATCHSPDMAFTDNSAVSTGINGQTGDRSAPTVINRAYSTLQFWDGRAASLEEQAIGPLANPVEMTNEKDPKVAHAKVVEKLKRIKGYVRRFKRAFGDPEITIERVGQAIATFERLVLSGNSPYDRYKAGDHSALTEAQKRGLQLFEGKAGCVQCHSGPNLTNEQFVNIGIGMDKPNPDLGRYVVTKKEEDKGRFKVPTLREIANTFPYMHDGSLETLEEVVEYMNKGGIKNPQLDPRIKPLGLTAQEKKDLVEFLKALSGEGWQQFQEPKRFPK